MNPRNQNHQQQQQQQPAQTARKAGGRSVVGLYLTQGGKVGAEIQVSASGRYRYIGAWGAGSGLNLESMRTSVQVMLRRRRGVVVEIPFDGIEVAP